MGFVLNFAVEVGSRDLDIETQGDATLAAINLDVKGNTILDVEGNLKVIAGKSITTSLIKPLPSISALFAFNSSPLTALSSPYGQISYVDSVLNSSGSLILNTNKDLSLLGAKFTAGEDLGLLTTGKLIIETHLDQVGAVSKATLTAGNNVVLSGTTGIAMTGASIEAGQNVALSSDQGSIESKAFKHNDGITDTTEVTEITDRNGSVMMSARDDIALQATKLTAGKSVSLVAEGNVEMTTLTETSQTKTSDTSKVNGKTTTTKITTTTTEEKGVQLSAGENV